MPKYIVYCNDGEDWEIEVSKTKSEILAEYDKDHPDGSPHTIKELE